MIFINRRYVYTSNPVSTFVTHQQHSDKMEQDHNSDVNVDMEEEEEALVVNNQTEDSHDDINTMEEEEEEEASQGLSYPLTITGDSEPIGAKKRKPQKTTKLQVRLSCSDLLQGRVIHVNE